LFIRTQTNADRTYLLLVENERVAGRVQQKIIARLGQFRAPSLFACGPGLFRVPAE
jgi:hypothetical protein